MRRWAPYKDKFDIWLVYSHTKIYKSREEIVLRVMRYLQFGLRQKFLEMAKMDMRRYNLARRLAGKKVSSVIN